MLVRARGAREIIIRPGQTPRASRSEHAADLRLEAVLLQLAIEAAQADAEQACRARAMAVRLLERLHDLALLELHERRHRVRPGAGGKRHGRSDRIGAEDRREVL